MADVTMIQFDARYVWRLTRTLLAFQQMLEGEQEAGADQPHWSDDKPGRCVVVITVIDKSEEASINPDVNWEAVARNLAQVLDAKHPGLGIQVLQRQVEAHQQRHHGKKIF